MDRRKHLPTTETAQTLEERWRHLTIANDFVFCKAMLDRDLCREVLEVVLGMPIDHVEYIDRQHPLDSAPNEHAVRLDVYARDGKGTVYDVEMQASDTYELPKRARFYHAQMAIEQLDQGRPYSELGSAFAIFICRFDPFGRGGKVYSFESRCREFDGLSLNDGATTLFLAAIPRRENEDTASSQLDDLLDYIARGAVAGTLSARLDERVKAVIRNAEWRREYMIMSALEQDWRKRGYDQGLEQGLEQGREEGRLAGANRLGALVSRLLAANRTDDAARVATDPTYREQLYRELDIPEEGA